MRCKITDIIIISFAVIIGILTLGEDGPSKSSMVKSRFDLPIWHPDACWDGKLVPLAGSGAVGHLDGPKREIMSGSAIAPALAILPPEAGPYGCLSYDPKLDRIHFVAGSARGYLDGPFSRARFGGHSYAEVVRTAAGGHLFYRTEPQNNGILRCLDFKKQEVRTISTKTKYIAGMVVDSQGKLYIKDMYSPLLEIISSDGSVEMKSVEMKEKSVSGFSGLSMVLDEKRERIYAAGYRGEEWYIYYWDLKDGSFHGVLPIPQKDQPHRRMNEAGPFEGTYLYNQMSCFWGPDDPDKRFLYIRPNYTHLIFRLDLEKKEIWACGVVDNYVRFVKNGIPGNLAGWSAYFTEDGDIATDIPFWNRPRIMMYKRLK